MNITIIHNRLSFISILTGLYIIFLIGIVVVFNKYALFILPLFLICPLVLLKFKLDIENYFLLYIISTPILQHFSFNGFYIGDFVITPHMVIQLILFLLIVIDYFSNYNIHQKFKFGMIEKLMVLFIFSSVLSLLFGYSLPENDVKRWLLFYTGIFETSSFYFITLFLLRNNKNFVNKVIIAIMISVFSSGIIALIEFNLLGFNFVKIFVSRMRYGFGFHNTNLYGIYSSLLFPIIVYLVYNNKSKAVRLFSILSFSLLTLLSIMCFNRGTFLTIAFQVLLLLIYTKNKKLVWMVLVAFTGAAIYFNNLLLFYLFRFSGSTNTANGKDYSALYRFEAWRVALKGILLYPFGVGGGGFQVLWEKFSYKPQIYLGTPHQLFLSIGIDYGILTLTAFILILYFSIYYSYRITKSGAQDSSLFKYIIISMTGFIVYSMLTDGELSHLSGFIAPNNGYTIILFAIFAIISFSYSEMLDEQKT